MRAGRVDNLTELIGGPTARGQIGDYKLYNAKVAFIVAHGGPASGYSPWGGKVVDADRVRPAGEPGNSQFGEWVLGFDQRVSAAEKITVVSDGTKGTAAVIRVEGADASIPLLDILLDGILPTGPKNLWITIDYTLEADAEALRVDVTVENRGSTLTKITMRQMGLLMGDGAQPWQPRSGFDSAQGAFAFYAAVADDVSYGIFDEVPLNLLVNYNSLILTSQGAFELQPQQERSFRSYLVVGDGGTVALERSHAAATGRARTFSTVTGVVKDGSGAPIAGARVHALLQVNGGDEAAQVARTGADGTYTLELPEGTYRLRATFQQGPATEPQTVTVPAGAAPLAAPELLQPSAGILAYQVTAAGSEQALPAKITVRALSGTPNGSLPAMYGTQSYASGAAHIVYGYTGSGQIRLGAGRYRVYASRGFEYTLADQEVEITSGTTTNFAVSLERVVDTTGYLCGDFHIHAQNSPDSDDTNELKVAGFAAEGLEVPVSTDHEFITDYTATVDKLELRPWMRTIVGEEVTTFSIGHFNAYPLAYDTTKRNNGFIEWYYKNGPEIFAGIRANPANPVVQINHPRSMSIGGYFEATGYDPVTGTVTKPEQWSTDFDAIEVMNGKSFAGPLAEVFPDWYSFLNSGKKVTAVGNSDSHNSLRGANIGYPRNFVKVPSDDLANFDEAAFIGGVKGGTVVVSGGLFMTASIGGKGPGELVSATGTEVELKVKVQAPPWMDATQLVVIANGEQVLDRAIAAGDADPSNAAVRLDTTLTLPVTKDTWFVVHARGTRSLDPVVPGARPYAFTNAIFVDHDGNGTFEAPGLGGSTP